MSNLSRRDRKELRDIRVEVRKDFTKACVDQGADGQGIAAATVGIVKAVFGGWMEGSRDEWEPVDQAKITIAENFGTHEVRAGGRGNDNVIASAERAGRNARQYIQDKSENGNWWGRLFGSPNID